jgi:hypothetical protein
MLGQAQTSPHLTVKTPNAWSFWRCKPVLLRCGRPRTEEFTTLLVGVAGKDERVRRSVFFPLRPVRDEMRRARTPNKPRSHNIVISPLPVHGIPIWDDAQRRFPEKEVWKENLQNFLQKQFGWQISEEAPPTGVNRCMAAIIRAGFSNSPS